MKWTRDNTSEYRSGDYHLRGNDKDGWTLRVNDQWICWAHELKRAKQAAKEHAKGKAPTLKDVFNKKEGIK